MSAAPLAIIRSERVGYTADSLAALRQEERRTLAGVAAHLAWQMGVPVADVRARCRRQPLVRLRAGLVLVGRDRLGREWTRIGRWLGRNHSTVMHAHELGTRMQATDPAFAVAIARVSAWIEGGAA